MLNALYPYIEQVAVEALMSKRAPLRRKNKVGLSLLALSGFFFGAFLIFGLIAGYGWLLTMYDQPTAALIAAGSGLLISAISSLIAIMLFKSKARRDEYESKQA